MPDVMRCYCCAEMLGVENWGDHGETRAPVTGDPVLCTFCKLLQTIDGKGGLRNMTPAEIKAMKAKLKR